MEIRSLMTTNSPVISAVAPHSHLMHFAGCGIAFILFLTFGCSGKATNRPVNGPKPYPAHGVVRIDGKPMSEATIVMESRNGGPAASAISKSDGTFVLTTYDDGDGAPAGDYAVIVMQYETPKVPAGFNADTSAPTKPPALISPAKYSDFSQSGLTTTIKPDGENVIELELKSTP